MSSKKRMRSHDSTSSNWSNGSVDKESKIIDKYNDRLNGYENEFLLAFEKPTQIYRYLRARHLISPIFLNRNLTYMRHRLCRSNSKRRRDFSVDSLLQYVIERKQREAIAEESSGNLTLDFLCVRNQSPIKDQPLMTLETSLLKMGHQKRKDVLAPIYHFSVGKCDININEPEEFENNRVTIYKSELNETNGHIVKHWSYSLLFIASFNKQLNRNSFVERSDKQENDMSLMNDFLSEDNTKTESSSKRRRTEEPNDTSYYKAELIIYDKHKHCLLTEGEYTVVLQPCAPPKANTKFCKYGKYSSWQEIDAEDIDLLSIEEPNKQYGSMEVFRKGPVLRFQLSWSLDPQKLCVNGLNPLLSNDNENDSGIGNTTSDNSSHNSYNGVVSLSSANTSKSLNSNGLIHLKKGQRVIYQFLFSNNTRQQTKPQNDLCCPWCSLNCQQLYSLIKHLKLCHNRFTFTYVPDIRCARIDVAINECYDGSYAGNPHDLSFSNHGFAFSRNGPVLRNPVTHVIVCRPKRHAHSLAEFDEPDDEDAINGRTYISGHNRLYYHTNSCLPIRPQEMDFDSESENDPQWMTQKTQMMIDEFTDVNEGEKEVMKAWNLHIMKNGFVGDCQIPLACTMFAEEKGVELLSKNLYKNLILHLNNIYDFGLLNATTFVDIVRKLDQKLKNLKQNRNQLTEESVVKLQTNSSSLTTS